MGGMDGDPDDRLAPDIAANLAAQGFKVEAHRVNLRPDAEGWAITCIGCGTTAKLDFDPGRAKVGMCPRCIRGTIHGT